MRVFSKRSKVYGVSVDWITATATSTTAQELLWDVGKGIIHEREDEGQAPSAWHCNGYRGWTCTGARLGHRPDGVMLQLSGAQKSENWQHAIGAAENVSRIDLTVDCRFHPVVPSVSRNVYVDAGHVPLRNGRRPKRSLIVNSDGGSTCYIGSRVSENFGRVYDKGREAEMAPTGQLWRWEVELKGKAALTAGQYLASLEEPAPAILHYVKTWWLQRAAVEIADAADMPTLVVSPRELSTDEQRLAWLKSSIQPCVRRLVDSVGRDRVLAALGLLPQSAVPLHNPASPSEVALWPSQSATFTSSPLLPQ